MRHSVSDRELPNITCDIFPGLCRNNLNSVNTLQAKSVKLILLDGHILNDTFPNTLQAKSVKRILLAGHILQKGTRDRVAVLVE